MILIIGHFEIQADKVAEFQAFAQSLIAPQRQVAGCLRFEILQDLDNANAFVMLETWQDRVSLNRHFDTEAYASADAKLGEWVVADPDWQEYEV